MKKKLVITLMLTMIVSSFAGCGDIEERTSEGAVKDTEVSESQIQDVTEDSTVLVEDWDLIQEYGFKNGYSDLSYILDPDTLKDDGDYYTVQATFLKPITISADMQSGDTCEIVVDELKQETVQITCVSEGTYRGDDDVDYYSVAQEDGSDPVLYCGSDDRVEAIFHEGTLYIRKDAETGAAIVQEPYQQFTPDVLTESSSYFNGVSFDENGLITALIYFGD